MANVILTRREITYESMDVLENMLSFTKHVSRKYDDKFAQDGAKIGYTLDLRKPSRSLGTTGPAFQPEDYIERSYTLVLSEQYQESLAFSSSDEALSLDDFSERVLKPRIINMANRIDHDGMGVALLTTFNEVGTPGTSPNNPDVIMAAEEFLQNEAAPQDDTWSLHLSPGQNRTLFPTIQGLLNNATQASYLQAIKDREGFARGVIAARTLSFDWFVDQNAPLFVVGSGAAGMTVSGAGQTGNALTTSAVPAGGLNAGDIFTVAGVNGINPLNRQKYSSGLRRFVVTAPVAAGATSIPFACVDGDGITIAGAYQTVDAAPANGAAITFNGAATTSTLRGLAFHKSAYTFASADLPLFDGVHQGFRVSDDQIGFSIRYIADYDPNFDRLIRRLDLLGGWGVPYPQMGVRVCS